MAISWNTGTTVSNGVALDANRPVTIPAGVNSGDVIIVAFCAFRAAATAETMQASSTGTAPTLIGSSQQTAFFNSNTVTGGLFSIVAGASDAGKVITGSLVSGDTANWAAAVGAWTGASNSSPVDVSGATTATGNNSSLTCPSETTGVANDWDLQVFVAALGGAAYGGGGGFTQRESVVDGSSGAGAVIYDSNGSVGGSGTGIGGANFTNAGNNSWWIGWTVGLAPAGGGTANTRTAALTVTPAFTNHNGYGRANTLTVTPAFSLVKAEAHKESATITPVFAATGTRNYGKGGADIYHHRRAGRR
jgi:hypothetical protein